MLTPVAGPLLSESSTLEYSIPAKRKLVYLAEGRGAAVSVVDVASRTVKTRVPVGERPWGIALSPQGDRLYTANGGSNDVSVVDTASAKTIARVPVGNKPYGVLYVP